ncbi:zinc finger, CCHC-type containing protein [Tanacetum coccineum]
MRLEVRSVLPKVTEHPDSDNGKREFRLESLWVAVVYVLTTPIPEDGENATVEQIRKKAKRDNDDYVWRGLILNGMSDPLFDIYQNVKSSKELWDSLEAKYMAENASIIYALRSPSGCRIMTRQRATMLLFLQLATWWSITTTPGGKVGNKGNGLGTNGLVDGSTNSLKGQNMFNKSLQVYYVTYVSKAYFVQEDDIAWWVDSGATVHMCKDRCWFKTYKSLNDGSILHMGNESTALVHERGCIDLRLNIVNDSIASAFMSASKVNDSILWHARLCHVHFKRMQDMSKDGLIPNFDMDTGKCKTCMLTKITKKPFQNVKRETEVLELIHSDLCDLYATPSLGNKKYFVIFIYDASRFCYVYLLHSKDETLDKFNVFKTEVELQ